MTETRGSIWQMYKYKGYTLLKRQDIDNNYWNACLDQCPYALPYAYTWWLDIVSPGWMGYVLADEALDGYSAVFPLPVVRKFGHSLLRQPVFGHQLGLFMSGAVRPDADRLKELLEEVCRRFRYIDGLALCETAGMSVKCPYAHMENYLVDLQQPYEQILNGYKGNRRREITQAATLGIAITETTSPEKMLDVFRQEIAPGIYGIDGGEYDMFRDLFVQWQTRDCVRVYEARLNGEWLAGAAILRWKRRLIYIFNASTEKGKELDALSYLIDRILYEHAGSKEPLFFDFEAPHVKPVLGYYKQFGGKLETYIRIQQNRLPLPMRMIQSLRKAWVQRAKK